MGTPSGPKYILDAYMDPMGIGCVGSRIELWAQDLFSVCQMVGSAGRVQGAASSRKCKPSPPQY